MKRLIKLQLLLLLILGAACSDPYKSDGFAIYDTQPASTYLSSRPEDFSEWIKVMKYADMYNAVNQATKFYTLFVPNNQAVEKFYERKGVSGIEELGQEYARTLVSFHLIQDTINQETFIEKEGPLDKKTYSDDFLSISYGSGEGDNGGINSLYINKEARVIELANKVSNGYVYVLENTLTPLTESVYERIADAGIYSIFKAALDATGWNTTINTIYEEVENSSGLMEQQKRNFTILAVPDEIFKNEGINDLSALVNKLGAGADYTNVQNELNRYVAYHIISGSYTLQKFKTFDTEDANAKIWNTSALEGLIKIRKEGNIYYLNYGSEESRTTFIEDNCDLQAKNGYIHQLAGYLPIADPEPEKILFDVCDYEDIKNLIESGKASPDADIKFQQISDPSNEKKCECYELPCYTVKLSKPGGKYSDYLYVAYQTSKTASSSKWQYANNCDLLMLNLGNTGSIAMQTPTIMKGKYKVIIQFGYATSMDFIKNGGTTSNGSGSNRGGMKISFDGENEISCKPYTSYTGTALDLFQYTAYEELEFSRTTNHTFKLVIDDPAASTHSKYRIYLDYILFEPIINE